MNLIKFEILTVKVCIDTFQPCSLDRIKIDINWYMETVYIVDMLTCMGASCIIYVSVKLYKKAFLK